jgi:hypothetical protein
MQNEQSSVETETIEQAKEGGRVQVGRGVGDCDFCVAKNIDVIKSFDSRIYKGAACSQCVLEGRTNETFKPDSKAMRPMVYVAKANQGIEPFASAMAKADSQRLGRNLPSGLLFHNRKARNRAAALARSRRQPKRLIKKKKRTK